MIIRVFNTGISRGAAVYEYLHSQFDANGDRRTVDPVELRGDANRFQRLIDECHRKWRYTSGVVSFSDFDRPDEDVQNEIMDAFEDFAFAGKDRSTWDIYWVRHQDKGNTELHFVIPRVDLETGQDLNAFQRGWDAHWRPFQRDICFQYGLADPHERRKVTASPTAKRETKERQALRTALYQKIEDGFKAGTINSRERLLTILSSA
ncbi:MAG: relaxase/mobilization nuclease domain-containing protein, partial [Pseudomonadota bacterium]